MTAARPIADLVRPRSTAPRWPYAVPAVVALLFVGHAIDDGGPGSASVSVGILALCAFQAMRPTVIGWLLLFATFLAYGLVVVTASGAGHFEERNVFFLLAMGPALALWLGRPWRRRRTQVPRHAGPR